MVSCGRPQRLQQAGEQGRFGYRDVGEAALFAATFRWLAGCITARANEDELFLI
jgi:hypothetical protein